MEPFFFDVFSVGKTETETAKVGRGGVCSSNGDGAAFTVNNVALEFANQHQPDFLW